MKKLSTAVIISVLLWSTVVTAEFINIGQANPYIHDSKIEGTVPPPEGTKPPVVLISNPANHTSYPSNNFSLDFSVTIEKSNNISLSLSELHYKASWLRDRTEVDLLSFFTKNNYTWPSTFSINVTDVPEGPHWIEVYAVATAFAYEIRHEVKDVFYTTYYAAYEITSSSIVNFTIDTIAPIILLLSVENKTYTTSDILLTFITKEPVSQTSYSLDGKDNVTIAGNTTLTGLTNGDHNLTIYATDMAGNIGASESIYFSVNAPGSLPTTLVATASGASMAIIGLGLLVYFKKRNRGNFS
ncbi:hypothetical protein G4O51_06630 [Candidatus Bathyarchaeota archaeon A05DMB-2]|nr:hypothetical protein [Candidatus Bathyarchaeota archaeon A05DMB-2]